MLIVFEPLLPLFESKSVNKVFRISINFRFEGHIFAAFVSLMLLIPLNDETIPVELFVPFAAAGFLFDLTIYFFASK